MKIIITGALGHIGSHLIRFLPFQFPGAEIVLIDNLATQRFPSLFNLPVSGNFRWVEGDVTTMELLPLIKNAQVLIHLAAITDAAASFSNASEVEANNYHSTLNVASACCEADVRLILLSSTSVYGTQGEVVSEDCKLDDLKPQSPYAETKLKEEKLICKLCTQNRLKAIICRFGTIFGVSPGMRFHTAVNKFCWQAAAGLPISVWRTAYDQKRPYLDLNDAASAIDFIIKNDLFNSEVFNILTCNATVRQVVDTIREFVPKLEIEYVDTKIMNQLSYEVSCSKFIAEGFTFAGDLKRGIADTIKLLPR